MSKFTVRKLNGHTPEKWAIDDENGHIAGEFASEFDALAVADRWTETHAYLLTLKWEPAPAGADDSHRGFYRFSLADCRGTRTVGSGWHSMEDAIRFSRAFRDNIAAHGIDAARAYWELYYIWS